MDDNLYPLDGKAFMAEPEEQLNERKLETAQAQAAGPMLEEIIERFRDKIDFYNSVESIPQAVQMEPETFIRVVEANKLTRNNLIAEVEWLGGLLEDQR